MDPRGALDPASCTCANLRKAARAVTQAYDDALRPSGMKSTQFTLLAALAKLGDMPLTKLAEVLVMDRTTLTRNLKPLLGKGWVGATRDADQRVRRIALTGAGRQAHDTALPLWRSAQSRLVGRLGPERWSGFLGDLSEAIAATQER